MNDATAGAGTSNDWADLGRRAFDAAADFERATATSVALHEIGVYLAGARRQVDRMAVSIDAARAALADERYDADVAEMLTVDTHFYFVCRHRVERMMFLLQQQGGLAAAAEVYRLRKAELLRHAEARHHITHIENRLPGKPKETLIAPGDGLWFFATIAPVQGLYRIGKETYDLSQAGLARLEAIAGELRAKVEAELSQIERPRRGEW